MTILFTLLWKPMYASYEYMTIVMISYHLSDFQMEIRSISGVSSREMSDNRRVNGFPGYTCGTGCPFWL